MTPLHRACVAKDLKAVEALLARGADFRVRDYRGWTPLDQAAALGLLPIVEVLLRAGADPGQGDLGGYTPLYRAVKASQPEVALRLLDVCGRAPVSREQSALSEVVTCLLPQDPSGPENLLVLAAEQGLAPVVKQLLSLSRTTWSSQERALLGAASQGREECVQLLLAGVAAARKNDALENAIVGSHSKTAEILLGAGAVPEDSTLQFAVAHNLAILPLLQERFPGRMAAASSLVHCQHPDVRSDEYGYTCTYCGAHWP